MLVNGINNAVVSNQYNRTVGQYNQQTSAKNSVSPSFKGKEGWLSRIISEFFGKHYGKPMYNKQWVQDISEKSKKIPGSMTEHMATLGSVLTSSMYMYKTLTNDDLDTKSRKTLAINQGLCCLIPAVCAYTVSHYLAKFKKVAEYTYCGLKEQQKALGQLSAEQVAKLEKEFGTKLKGFNALTSLVTFTLIYRYITPVVITPVANYIGEKINAKHHTEEAKQTQTENKAA